MKILLLGSGGREHALAWKLKQSPLVRRLWCAPGNAGIATLADLLPIQAVDVDGLLAFAKKERVDLTIVGPEQPLVNGIVDVFEEAGLRIFGPSRAAARLEGSKVFAKNFMARYRIPTARYRSFGSTEMAEARAYCAGLKGSLVIKADGLAAGKGVLICGSFADATAALDECFTEKTFGEAGSSVVIEEFLEGEEVSMFVVTDGDRFVVLASAQDHKRILDGDKGKNTGGMGAYAPAPLMTPELHSRVVSEIVEPTLAGMRAEGTPFRGCLFIGLMVSGGAPKVLEYNCRFGDPETQVVVPLLDADLAQVMLAAAERRLEPSLAKQHHACAVCVVMASQGYPDSYDTGKLVIGLDTIRPEEGVVVFHAGTRRESGNVLTAGGRVLGITAIGFEHELAATIGMVYGAVGRITFDGAYYRSDIGYKALRRLQ